MFNGIKNRDALETSRLREIALDIVTSGLEAIDTKGAINSKLTLQEKKLSIQDVEVSLRDIERIHIIGFGKTACAAAQALESKLGNNVSSGVAIDNKDKTCEIVDTYTGAHPKPTEANVEASREIVDLAESLDEQDLVIVAVSGGGSSLLCWPPGECQQSQVLYDKFLESGGTIQELNTVRKHLSQLKGGGLAQRLYPARVLGLIFSDVPGGSLSDVASGPTYPDNTTADDAKRVLDKYEIKHDFDFYESPKDEKYFNRVDNLAVVTNRDALLAMRQTAAKNNLQAKIISPEIYDFPQKIIRSFFAGHDADVIIGGGETRIELGENPGDGGRNQHLALSALEHIKEDNQLFMSVASDGYDNSEVAGALVDNQTVQQAKRDNIDPQAFIESFDSRTFFQTVGDYIKTGQTGANVADLMMHITYE
jgi:glycerate-2-kinase